MKKRILMAALVMPLPAFAVEVDVYGQVNKTFVMADDRVTTETAVVDNDFSSTRIGIKGSEVLDNGLKVGVALEYELQSNDSEKDLVMNDDAGASTTPKSSSGELRERVARISIGADLMGTVALGKLATATDSVTEIDLGGVQDVMGSAVDRMGGGLKFYNRSAGVRDAITVGSMIDNMEGQDDLGSKGEGNFDQVNAIGYRSPIVSGLQLRAASMQGGDIDLALRYNAKIGTLAIAAGLGYYQYNNEQSTSASGKNYVLSHRYSGGLSVKHDSGFSATAAFGTIYMDEADANVKDPEFYYTKFGYEWDKYALAVDYGSYSDIDPDTPGEATTFGVGAQANLGHGFSTAAFYRNISPELEDTSKDLSDVSLMGVNLRLKF